MPLQATSGAASYDAFGGGVPYVPAYIEQLFSTFLYDGTSSTQVITNEIDLSTKGGLVWIKGRVGSQRHVLTDTNRGVNSQLYSNRTDFEATATNCVTAFNTTGFTLGANSFVNDSSAGSNTFVSWTFRKQPKFFTAISYTGDGTAGKTVSHNLGSTPGCMIIKRISSTSNWAVYHRSLGGTQAIQLNLTSAATTSSVYWNDTDPTSTVFTLGDDSSVNANGNTYIAYLYAHDAGGFGLTGTDNVISCGSYTGTGAAGNTITLGYEPQWLMIKRADSTSNWYIFDVMRGMPVGGTDQQLSPNLSDAENPIGSLFSPTATGFTVDTSFAPVNASGGTYIYIAIRRGPMKVPTDATKVFAPVTYTGNGSSQSLTAGFPISLGMFKYRNGATNSFEWFDRLRGAGADLRSAYTYAELATTTEVTSFASNTQVTVGSSSDTGGTNVSGQTYVLEAFQRAPSFFDEVCYTGTSTDPQNYNHNLQSIPEMMIVRRRNQAGNDWFVYHKNLTSGNILKLNTTASSASDTSIFTTTAPTASVFTVGGASDVNSSSGTYVWYGFATCAGVSKCTSFTGTGTLQTIDCGFTAGSRFVLIKRTDSTGDWYVWDSSRGLSSSTDPYLLLNSTAAEVTSTNWVDTTSTGFQVTAASGNNVNINGASYIALAIA
jgi:hypothetical protein